MAYTAPLVVVTGDLATASQYNTFTKDNLIAIYAGEMSIASQAAEDDIFASTATQLGRRAHAQTHLKNWMSYLGGEI